MINDRKTIKIGLIGSGHVTECWHLPALRNLNDASITAISDIDSEKLNRVANLYRIKNQYTHYQDLIKDPDVEAVAVCVPVQFHTEIGLEAMNCGKHVFMEKPLALNIDDCEKLIKKAKESGLVTMLGFNFRWHRLIRRARRFIDQGALGRIKMIRSVFTCSSQVPDENFNWRKKRDQGGGTLIEIAVHHYDLWRFLLQSEVDEIYAMSRSYQLEDEVSTVMARMRNGVLAVSCFSEITNANNSLEIYGQNGQLRISCYRFDGLEFFSIKELPGDIKTRLKGMAISIKDSPRLLLKKNRAGDFALSFRAEWRHFIDCIKKGIPAECTFEDGKEALQIVLTGIESAVKNRAVNIRNVKE